jgi:hypothetical protein
MFGDLSNMQRGGHNVRIDERAKVTNGVCEVHPTRHPRAICQTYLHARSRLCLVHLEVRVDIVPFNASNRTGGTRAADRK